MVKGKSVQLFHGWDLNPVLQHQQSDALTTWPRHLNCKCCEDCLTVCKATHICHKKDHTLLGYTPTLRHHDTTRSNQSAGANADYAPAEYSRYYNLLKINEFSCWSNTIVVQDLKAYLKCQLEQLISKDTTQSISDCSLDSEVSALS